MTTAAAHFRSGTRAVRVGAVSRGITAAEQLVMQQEAELTEQIAQLARENALLKLELATTAKAALQNATAQNAAAEARAALSYINGTNTDSYLGDLPEAYVGQSQYAAMAVASPVPSSPRTPSPKKEKEAAVKQSSASHASSSAVVADVAPAATKHHSVEQTNNPMRIVFVSSEVAPWSKTGGLADVCGSLPKELVARGHRVMVIAPRYINGSANDALYQGAFDTLTKAKLGCFGGLHEVGFFHQIKDGVDFVFVDHPSYQRPGGLYGDTHGVYGDNQVCVSGVFCASTPPDMMPHTHSSSTRCCARIL